MVFFRQVLIITPNVEQLIFSFLNLVFINMENMSFETSNHSFKKLNSLRLVPAVYHLLVFSQYEYLLIHKFL